MHHAMPQSSRIRARVEWYRNLIASTGVTLFGLPAPANPPSQRMPSRAGVKPASATQRTGGVLFAPSPARPLL